MNRFKKTLIAAAAAATMALGGSQAVTASAAGANDPTDTYMIGDSMTVRGYFPYLHDRRPGWYVDGVGGRPVTDLPDRFDFMVDRLGFRKNIIIALGTNPDPTDQWSKADYLKIVDAIPTTTNVFLVTPYRGPSWGGVEQVDKYAQWMYEIWQARSNVYLIDWRKQVLQGNVRLADGIHAQRGPGEEFWKDLINDRVVAVNTP